MIARRATARERRAKVREHLSRAAKSAGQVRAQRVRSATGRRDGGEADVDRLARVLVELGLVFASYGTYLASRGDQLTPADQSRLAALDRAVPPLPPAVVHSIVCSDAIATLDEQPFDTRLLIQRHYGQLADGRPVVVRVARTDRWDETDLDALPLLRDLVTPLLSDARLFEQTIEDFRASFAAQGNHQVLADALEALSHALRDVDSLTVPEVHRTISTPRALIVQRLPGRRLADDRGPAAAIEDESEDGGREESESLARLVCEQWLRMTFDAGLVSTDMRAEDILVLSRSRIAIDEGAFSILPNEVRVNWLKYLVAIAVDEPRQALDSLLQEFVGLPHRTSRDELERLFRQMVPDPELDESCDGPAGRLITTLRAQWRLAIVNGYRPLRPSLALLRGVARLSDLVGTLAPRRDAFLDGLKDYRVTRLVGDVQAMFEPLYWFGRFDRIAYLMMSSPRILDDAIAAALPDRAAAVQRASGPRGRANRLDLWLVPTLAALVVVGLTHGRGPPAASGAWEEALAGVLFLLIGGSLLRNAAGSQS